jgi:hypothetical protein
MRWRTDAHFIEALYVVFLAFCLVLLSSCAHDPALQRKIVKEEASVPALGDDARAQAAQDTIAASPLSPQQKMELQRIAASARDDLAKLKEQNEKLRLLLIRQMVNPDASDREVAALKQRILENDQKSDKRWLTAVNDAQRTLGRRTTQDMRFFRQLDPVLPETTEPRARLK